MLQTFSESGEKCGLGAGININMPQELLDSVDQPATSLMVETGKAHDREDLIKTLDTFFLEDYHLYRSCFKNVNFAKVSARDLVSLKQSLSVDRGDEKEIKNRDAGTGKLNNSSPISRGVH